MSLLVPGMLVWMWVAAAAVVLYLVRRKPRTVQVTTLPFFLGLSQAFAESAWLRRLKRMLSLLLTLLVIIGAVLALGRLVVQPGDEAVRLIVVLVDQSASMGAVDGDDVQGQGKVTRLERGLEQVRARLAALPESVAVSLIAYDRRAHVLQPPTRDRRSVLRSIDDLAARPVAGDSEAALALAQQVAGLDRPAVIWHVSDGGGRRSTPAGDEAEAIGDTRPATDGDESAGAAVTADAANVDAADDAAPVERIAVGSGVGAVNVGITSFAIRRLPMQPNRVEAFVRIEAAGAEVGSGAEASALEVDLEVLIDGNLVALRELTLKAGGAANFPVPVEAGEGSMLTLRVAAAGDVLAWDDSVTSPIPEARPVRVVWVTAEPDPFTQLALTTLAGAGEVEVFRAGPDDWPLDQEADVVLFDGWQPETWPADLGVVVINPTAAQGPAPARRLDQPVAIERVRPVDEQHPVLLGVATGRLSLTQTAVLAGDGPVRPLLAGPAGPLLSAGVVEGRRVVAMAFDPGQSERLPLTASYPLMIGNALYWCANAADRDGQSLVQRTGELLATHGQPLQWQGDEQGGREATRPSTVSSQWVELDRIGVWQLEHDGQTTIGSTALLSAGETRLAIESPSAALQEQTLITARWAGDWSMWLVALALVALLAESVLFHRWAVW